MSRDRADSLKGMIPFIADKSKARPKTNEEIERVFEELIADLGYDVKTKNIFDSYDTKQKKDFIQQQEDHERRVPAPEWLIDEMSKNFSGSLLNTTIINLKTSRLAWVDRFCTSGGHILLLQKLARTTAYSQRFTTSFPYDLSQRADILKALRSTADCRSGSKHMLYFVPGIEILVQAIDKTDIDEFENILYILLPFIFLDHGPINLLNSFKRLAQIYGYKSPFRVFNDVIATFKTKTPMIFFSFVKGLYDTIAKRSMPDKVRMSLDYEVCHLTETIAKVVDADKTQFEMLQPVLQTIQTDFIEISELFKGDCFNCTLITDLSSQLENEKTFGTLLANLVSLKRNQAPSHAFVIEFICNFLLSFRKNLVEGNSNEQSLKNAVKFAQTKSCLATYNLPESSHLSQNSVYQYLNDQYSFISDEDLHTIAVEDDPKPEGKSQEQQEIEDLKEQVRQLQEQLEAQKAATPASNDSDKDHEIQRLKDELDEAKAQNEKLQMAHMEIQELVNFIPTDLQAITLKNYDLSALIPSSSTNPAATLESIRQLRAKLTASGQPISPELDELLKLIETQLQALIDDRKQIEQNAQNLLKEIREDCKSANSEFNQVIEIQTKIINGVKAGSEEVGKSSKTDSVQPVESGHAEGKAITKQFCWDKLDEQTAVATREWSESIKAMIKPAEAELDELFSVEIEEGHLLSSNSIKAYESALQHLERKPEVVITELKTESFKLSEAHLAILYHLPLVQVEIQKINAFNGDVESLPVAEKFAVLLHRIPDWRHKIINMIEHHRFDHDITIALQEIDKFKLALEQLQKSKKFPRILGIILSICNYLNEGTESGACSGFQLNNLRDLKYVKSNKKGVTLLNYIVSILERDHVDLLQLQSELTRLQTASRISVGEIMEKLKRCQTMLASRERTPFVRASSRRIFEAMNIVQKVQDTYDEMARNYGVHEELLKPATLLTIILDFSTDLSRALKDNRLKSPQAPSSPSKPIDTTQQRGILTSMKSALEAPVTYAHPKPGQDETGERVLSDFEKAFAKVKKTIDSAQNTNE